MNLYNFEVLQISASNYKYFQKVLVGNSFRIKSTSFTMLRSVTNVIYIVQRSANFERNKAWQS